MTENLTTPRPASQATHGLTAEGQPGTKPVGPLELIAVDDGNYYDARFVVSATRPKKQTIRIFGRNFTPRMDVRLSSRTVRWTKFRHENLESHPAPEAGPDVRVVVVRDIPVSRDTTRPMLESSTDSGDLIVTLTSAGTPTVIMTNQVDYILV